MKSLKNLKAGDEFAYKNIGYGLVSYEKGDDATGRKKGRLMTECFSDIGMDWDERQETWFFDSGLGLRTEIVRIEDVPLGGFEQ